MTRSRTWATFINIFEMVRKNCWKLRCFKLVGPNVTSFPSFLYNVPSRLYTMFLIPEAYRLLERMIGVTNFIRLNQF